MWQVVFFLFNVVIFIVNSQYHLSIDVAKDNNQEYSQTFSRKRTFLPGQKPFKTRFWTSQPQPACFCHSRKIKLIHDNDML